MIRVTGRGLVADAQATHYSVAGQALVCQNSLAGLTAYSTGLATPGFTDLLGKYEELPTMTTSNARLRYSGKAYFCQQFRDVRFWRSTGRGQLDIDGVPACQIDFNESHIHVLNDQPLGGGLNLELITGPALVLLLAQNHTYCMHAGAVDTPAGRIGITAESGAGKSTLSCHVNDQWSQVVDDVMPVTLADNDNEIEVLPDFPQLKLTNHCVTNGPRKRKALDYLLRINPEPSLATSFVVLPRIEAMLQVVRHTVAAKLFDTKTLAEHAAFAKKVSTSVPVIEVSYPRDIDQLEHLRGSIVEYLGALE